MLITSVIMFYNTLFQEAYFTVFRNKSVWHITIKKYFIFELIINLYIKYQ